MDQTLHTVATKVREEIKGKIKQKMARRHNKEGGNHLDQESNRQKAMEDTDGGLQPAVDGQSQSLGEGEVNSNIYCAQKETNIFNVAISNELFDWNTPHIA